MNNTFPKIHIIYNRRKTASRTRKASLEILISHNYKQKYISTGIMLYPNQWKKGLIVNCQDIQQLSKVLNKQLTDIRTVLAEMVEAGHIDLRAIPDRIKQLYSNQINFLEFCSQRAEVRKFGKKQDSKERYNRFLKLFTAWGKIQKFEDVTEKNIIAYDDFLSSTGMKNYSKWNNYHRFLNSFILDAIDAGHIKKNPYRWVNIEKDKTSGNINRCLTPIQFRKIRRAKMHTPCLERVRDLFVFQTYTCMSYSDLRDFNPGSITKVKNMQVYTGKRNKTSKPFTIPLVLPAMNILRKYQYQLPIISNVKYNEYLKVVAQAAKIDKPISSHWARHTGATILLNEGIDIKIVSKICGHSSTRITEQVYAKLLDETVVDAISSLNEK